MPLPNASGGQLITTFPTPADNDQYLFRVDWNIGRHVIDGRYNLNKAYDRASAGNVPEYLPLDRSADVNSITIGDTWSVRPIPPESGADFVQSLFFDLHKSQSDPSERPGRKLSAVGGPKIPPNIAITGRVTLGDASSVDAIAVNEGLQVNESVTWTDSGTRSEAAMSF